MQEGMHRDLNVQTGVHNYSGHNDLLFLSHPLSATKMYEKSLLFKGITTKNVLESS